VTVYEYSSVSPSGSLAVVASPTVVFAVAGQLPELECVPGAHGIVIDAADAANAAVGGWFGNIAGSRLLRRPKQR